MPTPSCTLTVKVIPNAPRTEVAGRLGNATKIKVHAPAMDGRANEELCAFLAEKLGLPKRAVTLLRGEKSRQKVIGIHGLDEAAIQARLN